MKLLPFTLAAYGDWPLIELEKQNLNDVECCINVDNINQITFMAAGFPTRIEMVGGKVVFVAMEYEDAVEYITVGIPK